jgi:hypothetical protein
MQLNTEYPPASDEQLAHPPSSSTNFSLHPLRGIATPSPLRNVELPHPSASPSSTLKTAYPSSTSGPRTTPVSHGYPPSTCSTRSTTASSRLSNDPNRPDALYSKRFSHNYPKGISCADLQSLKEETDSQLGFDGSIRADNIYAEMEQGRKMMVAEKPSKTTVVGDVVRFSIMFIIFVGVVVGVIWGQL